MNAGELMALAERVGAATESDAELDVLIAEDVGWQSDLVARARTWSPCNDTKALAHDVASNGCLRGLPRYTASLDAAATLMPEGWFTRLAAEDRHSHSWRWDLRGSYGIEAGSRASTPALALTAACLRARAALAPSDLASKSEVRDDG